MNDSPRWEYSTFAGKNLIDLIGLFPSSGSWKLVAVTTDKTGAYAFFQRPVKRKSSQQVRRRNRGNAASDEAVPADRRSSSRNRADTP